MKAANTLRTALIGGMLLLLLAACGGEPPITTCEPGHGIEPDCRFQNPEDMVVSPGGEHLIISQMGDMEGTRPGNLVSFQPDSGEILTLFPRSDMAPLEAAPGWGDPACPAPDLDAFAPHGIDIASLDDGREVLYAINHGARESVEMFEVAETETGPALAWRGCVLADDQQFFNDLVILPDGGFWITHMYPRDASILWTLARVQLAGYRPGRAYAWQPETGFTPIPGSEVAFGNGLERTPDNRLFLNDYLGEQVVVIDVDSGERLAEIPVPSPDNSIWAPTGEILVAGHTASLGDSLTCQDLETGSCGFGFALVAIDPETYQTRVVLEHEGAPMGAATVALPFREHVYLGTFAGDRIARVSANILERD